MHRPGLELAYSKAAYLRERAAAVRSSERAARERPVKRLSMDSLTPEDRRRLRLDR